MISEGGSDISTLADKLNILDNEIISLYNEGVDISSLYSIKLHRSKLAKRFLEYEEHLNNIKKIYNLHGEIGKTIYYKHLNNYSSYKDKLFNWWVKIQKRYNKLCMSSLITDNKSTFSTDVTLKEKLSDTKKKMLSLDYQMQAAETNILKTSEYINEQQDFYSKFNEHLSKTSSMLSQLHYRLSKRQTFIYACFYIQLFIYGFIILRRLSIIAIAVWIFKSILKLLNHIKNTIINIFTGSTNIQQEYIKTGL